MVSKGFQHQFWQAVKAGAEMAAEDYIETQLFVLSWYADFQKDRYQLVECHQGRDHALAPFGIGATGKSLLGELPPGPPDWSDQR